MRETNAIIPPGSTAMGVGAQTIVLTVTQNLY